MKIEELSNEDLLKYCLKLEESGEFKGWEILEKIRIGWEREMRVSYFTYKVSLGKKYYVLEYLVKYTVYGVMFIFPEVKKEIISANLSIR